MAKSRIAGWVALVVIAVGVLLAGAFALWAYKSVTTPILHPDPQQVPSIAHSQPAEEWTAAVERARLLMRAALVEQNLPGVSVAVGIQDEIVWAEGHVLGPLRMPETTIDVATETIPTRTAFYWPRFGLVAEAFSEQPRGHASR